MSARRCIGMLAQLGERAPMSPDAGARVAYLRNDQEQDGSWFGRWGMNYIYGTWSALCALERRRPRPATIRRCAGPSSG